MNPTVYFETLTHWHRPLVAWYRMRGYRVHVFDFTYRLKTMGWLRRAILEERVERIYTRFSRADGMAMDAAERLYPAFSRHPLIRSLGQLFGTEEADAVFKSALVEHLTRYFFMQLYFEGLEEKQGAVLISESAGRWSRLLSEDRSSPFSELRQPRLLNLFSRVVAAAGAILGHGSRYVAMALVATYVGVLLKLRGHSGRRRAPSQRPALAEAPPRAPAQQAVYLYAISSAFQMRRSGTRRFDFLLDHRRLTKANTLFLLEVPEDPGWAEAARTEGYRVLRLSDWAGLRSLWAGPARSVPWKSVGEALWQALKAVSAGAWMHEAAVSGLQLLIKESRFLEEVEFEHYIYANQYGLVPRWRNILLRKSGRTSWWFAYSTGGGFLYWEDGVLRGDNDYGGRHHYWAYQNADHFVSPCAPLIAYHREHRQRIRFYHDVGNLWSELILREEGRQGREELRRAWFGEAVSGKKIVAWFDTTFSPEPHSPATFEEAAIWYRDILRLAQEREDLRMVIKPSKDEAFYVSPRADQQWSLPRKGREVLEAWAALRQHPRVRFLSSAEDPNPVVLGSDLTVTFCFSAVSAEALGARRKGIWYEPGQRWRKTLLGKDPLLTAHGYEELRRLVQRQLYEMEGQAAERFLEQSVRGPVDSFLDGRGLSRFRELIAQTQMRETEVGDTARSPSVLSVHG